METKYVPYEVLLKQLSDIVERIDDRIFYLKENVHYGIGDKAENERQIYILTYIKTGVKK